MLTRLGSKAVPEDAVGMLLECHARIREFVALARRLGDAADAPADVIQETARRVRRYFADALPLHAQDEEESLLPRVRGRDAALDRELSAMAREHREHEEPLARLVAACRALEQAPARLAEFRQAVASPAAELDEHFVRHLSREESAIFPALRRLLRADDDAAVVREIRARRSPVSPSPPQARGERSM